MRKFQENDNLNGNIVWLDEPFDVLGRIYTDKQNEDPTKRNRMLLGLPILTGFSEKNHKWINGAIYIPSEGKTYKAKIWLEGQILKVRFFIGLVPNTQTWTKYIRPIKDVE